MIGPSLFTPPQLSKETNSLPSALDSEVFLFVSSQPWPHIPVTHKAIIQGAAGKEPLAQPSASVSPSQTPENVPPWPCLHLGVSVLRNPGNRRKRGCWDQNLPFCHHQHERPWQGLGPQRVCLPNLWIQSSQRTRLASGLNFCLSTSTGQDGVPCAGTGDGRASLRNGLAGAA